MSALTFIFDLDGVIYRGEQPLHGAVDTVTNLRQLGHQVFFFTNNSTVTRTIYSEKLQSMGIPAEENDIMTSAYATALYMIDSSAQGKSAYIVGEDGPRIELSAVGLNIVENGESPVDYVVVGLDRKFNYDILTQAQQAIIGGAKFIAMNTDPTFPLEGGRIVPGGGALVAAIELCTDVKPTVIGKPEIFSMRKLLDLAGTTSDRTVVVGDRLDTDILGGKRIGALSVLVLTGVTSREMLSSIPPELQPDMVIETLPELIDKVPGALK